MKHQFRYGMKDVQTLPAADVDSGHNFLVAKTCSRLKKTFQKGSQDAVRRSCILNNRKCRTRWQSTQDSDFSQEGARSSSRDVLNSSSVSTAMWKNGGMELQLNLSSDYGRKERIHNMLIVNLFSDRQS